MREAYCTTFHSFNIEPISAMTSKDVQRIMDANGEDPTNMVLLHRGKIESVIKNVQRILDICQQEAENSSSDTTRIGISSSTVTSSNKKVHQPATHGIFDRFIWYFVNKKPILNIRWKHGEGLTNSMRKSTESEAMSKALKKRGFRFVGPNTCYAMMQIVGMIIDHPTGTPK